MTIKPYYDRGGITLYCADNRKVLPELAGAGVDIVFTSPPYNVGLSPGGNGLGFYNPRRGTRVTSKWTFNGYASHDDSLDQAEYETWQRQVLRWCWDALSDSGAIFYNHKPRIIFKRAWLPTVLVGDLPLRQVLVWDGDRGFGLGETHFCPAAEWILLIAKEDFQLRDRAASALTDLWRVPSGKQSQRASHIRAEHPAEFPVALPGRAIAAAARCELVLDPHAGTGGTLLAAKAAGCRAIGIEISERYCEIAAERLAQDVLPWDTRITAAAARQLAAGYGVAVEGDW